MCFLLSQQKVPSGQTSLIIELKLGEKRVMNTVRSCLGGYFIIFVAFIPNLRQAEGHFSKRKLLRACVSIRAIVSPVFNRRPLSAAVGGCVVNVVNLGQ